MGQWLESGVGLRDLHLWVGMVGVIGDTVRSE